MNSVTVTLPTLAPFQFILRLWSSTAELLNSFDVDCCAFAASPAGGWLVGLPRALNALSSGVNIVDLRHRSWNYEERLIKYATRGFSVFDAGLDVRQVTSVIQWDFLKARGLKKLILAEYRICQNLPITDAIQRAHDYWSASLQFGSFMLGSAKEVLAAYGDPLYFAVFGVGRPNAGMFNHRDWYGDIYGYSVDVSLPHLPIEMIGEVLQYLPVNSLLACRSVSKEWMSFIDYPTFSQLLCRRHFPEVVASIRAPVLVDHCTSVFRDLVSLKSVAWGAPENLFFADKFTARARHSSVVHEGRIIIFGGVMGSVCFDDVFVYDVRLRRFYLQATSGVAPAARFQHSATLVGNYMVVLFGRDLSTCFDDGWCLDLLTFQWSPLYLFGSPQGRSGHTATLISSCEILVLGGFDLNSNALVRDAQSVITLSGPSGSWSPLQTSGAVFRPRRGHSATRVKHFVVVFGGAYPTAKTLSGNLDDVMVLDLRTRSWFAPICSGRKLPGRRRGHTATGVGSRMIVFGGVNGEEKPRSLCVLDTDTWKWSSPSMVSGEPFPRIGHAAMLIGSGIVFTGGHAYYGGKKYLKDISVVRLSSGSNEWTLRRVKRRDL